MITRLKLKDKEYMTCQNGKDYPYGWGHTAEVVHYGDEVDAMYGCGFVEITKEQLEELRNGIRKAGAVIKDIEEKFKEIDDEKQ